MALLTVNNNYWQFIDAFLHYFGTSKIQRGNRKNSFAFVRHERSSQGPVASLFTSMMQKRIRSKKEIVKKIFFDA